MKYSGRALKMLRKRLMEKSASCQNHGGKVPLRSSVEPPGSLCGASMPCIGDFSQRVLRLEQTGPGSAEAAESGVETVSGELHEKYLAMGLDSLYHLLKRNFTFDCPNRTRVGNITYIPTGEGSIRKVKRDKADARRIAKYTLDNWVDLREYTPMEAIQEQLRLSSRQDTLYMKNVVALQNNLNSLTDKVFPRGERTVSQPNRTGVKSGLIFSRPSGIVSVFAWSARKPSQDVTRNGASGRDIISAHPKRRSRIWAVQAISRSCSETAIPSCSLPPPPRTGFCEGCAGRHAL